MLCKKCGLENADTSNFCAFCGNKLHLENEINVNSTVFNDMPNSNINVDENEIKEIIEEKEEVISKTPLDKNIKLNSKNKKFINNKTSKLIFIISGIVIVVLLIIFILFKNYNDNKYITMLNNAFDDLKEKFNDSVTLTADFSISSNSGNSIVVSSWLKMEKKLNEKYDFQVHVEQSPLFDEINMYAIKNRNEFTMFIESKMIDTLFESSYTDSIWLYNIMPIIQNKNEFDLSDVINKDNFMFIEKKDNLNHYALTLDENLINKLKEIINEVNNETLQNFVESLENLDNQIIINFYITNNDEIKKIQLDLTGYLKNTELTTMMVDLELKDLNNTKVEIPEEAKATSSDVGNYILQKENNYIQ